MTARFEPDERERIVAAEAAARAEAEAAGFALPTAGAAHASYRRWLQARIRTATRSRPRTPELAAILLSWSRERRDVGLYALCPLAQALAERHGEAALDAVPSLRRAYGLMGGPAEPAAGLLAAGQEGRR